LISDTLKASQFELFANYIFYF